jgi:hypothetical protein
VEYSFRTAVETTRADDVAGRIGRAKLSVIVLSSLSSELDGKLYYRSSLSSVCLLEYSLSNESGGGGEL